MDSTSRSMSSGSIGFRSMLASSFSGEHPSPPVVSSWSEVDKTIKAVKGFLCSFHPGIVGKGFMLFDKKKFLLEPRSYWCNHWLLQAISTIGDKRATFTAVLNGFTDLYQKVDSVRKKILGTEFNEENCREGEELLTSLIGTQIIINGSADLGLNRMAENYSNRAWKGDQEKAGRLSTIGKKVFALVNDTANLLTDRLRKFIPDIDVRMILETYSAAAKTLLCKRDEYRENLRATVCDMKSGLKITAQMVFDSLGDKIFNNKPNRDALKVSANLIELPTCAEPIPTQGGKTMWLPLRLVVETVDGNSSIRLETGVVGVCERTSADSDNLCNLYYRIDPDTRDVIISSGAIDTPLKAAQLCFAMNEVLKLIPEANGRWIVHQLNSNLQEYDLIRDVHANVALRDSYFQDVLKRKDLSLLHVNTCFNAAKKWPNEDAKSVTRINIDSLAMMSEYLFTDINELLKGSTRLTEVLEDPDNPLKSAIANAVRTGKLIKEIKQTILNHKEYGVQSEITELKTNTDSERFERSASAPELAVDSNRTDRMAVEDLASGFVFIDESLPTDITELKGLLSKKQKQLKKELKTLRESLLVSIKTLEARNFVTPEAEEAELLLKVFERVLSLQLKIKDNKPLSRSGEVELFLLLYRLLKIKPIIICYSGLDRSGAVRALADSQSQLLREFLEWRKGSAKAPIEEKAADIDAKRKLFHLIEHLDEYRNELFLLMNEIIAEHPNCEIIKDLESFEEKGSLSFDLREELVNKINDKYPEGAGERGEELLVALYYFELFGKHLMGTEMEKTLFSAGVCGLKYHHDANKLKKWIAANPHPAERLPPFLSAVDHKINIIKLRVSEQGINKELSEEPSAELTKTILLMDSPTNITPAGITLINRLSKLRGT